METITVLIIVSAVVITVQSEYYANYNDQLARDFMHFGKRSPDMILQFDGDNTSPKRGEFSRDFMNFGKRSIGDNWSDTIVRVDDTPELLHKKSNFDREFMNFGKRMIPYDRNLINFNKKNDVKADAFKREFLSFG